MENEQKKKIFRGIGLKRQIGFIVALASIIVSLIAIGSCYSYYDREFQEHDQVDISSFKGRVIPIHNNTAYQPFDFEQALKWGDDSNLIVMQNNKRDELRLVIVRNDPQNNDFFQYAVKSIEHPSYSIKDPVVVGKKIRYRIEREGIMSGAIVLLILLGLLGYFGIKVYYEFDW